MASRFKSWPAPPPRTHRRKTPDTADSLAMRPALLGKQAVHIEFRREIPRAPVRRGTVERERQACAHRVKQHALILTQVKLRQFFERLSAELARHFRKRFVVRQIAELLAWLIFLRGYFRDAQLRVAREALLPELKFHVALVILAQSFGEIA